MITAASVAEIVRDFGFDATIHYSSDPLVEDDMVEIVGTSWVVQVGETYMSLSTELPDGHIYCGPPTSSYTMLTSELREVLLGHV